MSNETRALMYIFLLFGGSIATGYLIMWLRQAHEKLEWQWYWGIGFAIGLDVDETQFFIILPGLAIWYELKKTVKLTSKKRENENTNEVSAWNDYIS